MKQGDTMKGCTDYTDEAPRWTRPPNRKPTLGRVILILVLGIAVVFAATIIWPRLADEEFLIASAAEKNPEVATGEDPGAASRAPVSQEGLGEAPQDATTDDDTPLVVYLTGAIAEPGVYELEQGSRLNDAIRLAGGLVEGSAVNYVNLAVPLEDGQHVHIPLQEEIESGEAARIAATGASASAGPSPEASQGEQKVNLNTADSAQLETLPGIGMATAQRILDYRAKNGDFATIEELKNVSGIGEKKFEGLMDKICV
jgi:competence protein ComEA